MSSFLIFLSRKKPGFEEEEEEKKEKKQEISYGWLEFRD